MNGKTVSSMGEIYVLSGGTANDTNVYYGDLYVFDGGVANSNLVSSGGIHVSGGTANFNTMQGYGTFTLSRGTANHTELNDGCEFRVFSGGTATDTTVNTYCAFYVFSGGEANSTTVKYTTASYFGSDGILYVLDGGKVNHTSLNGDLHVSSGGLANSTTVNTSGDFTVFSGGTANDTTVNSGGELFVSSGGVANDNTVNGGVYVFSGGTANRTTLITTVYSSRGRLQEVRGSLHVLSGGTANDTMIESGGRMVVSSFGIANSVEIAVDGLLYVLGAAGGLTDRGGIIVSSGGSIRNTTVHSGGSLHVSGGTADHVTLQAGGQLVVSSGGSATDIIWTPCEGYLELVNGAYYTFATDFSGVYYGEDGQLLSHAAVMDRKEIFSSAGSSGMPGHFCSMYVFSGGTADNATVTTYGRLVIFSGGTANDASVARSGTIQIFSGTLNSAVVNASGSLHLNGGQGADITVMQSGKFNVFSGGTANHNVIAGGVMLLSGGTAIDTVVISDGAVSVFSGGAATDTLVCSGALFVSSSGMVNNITVDPVGWLYVLDGGTAANIVENGGYVSVGENTVVNFLPNSFSGLRLSNYQSTTVHSGTTATDTIIEYGSMYVYSGGTANENLIYSGAMYVSGGQMSRLTLGFGNLYVYGGTAEDISLLSGRLQVSSGGTANDVVFNGGTISVSEGMLNDVTQDRGVMNVYGGGTVRDLSIGSVALTVADGGLLTGQIRFGVDATVSMSQGSVLDFDLTQIDPGGPALVNEISRISGTPTYTLTVSESQAKGVYLLSEGVDQFDPVITVRNTAGEDLGTISLESPVGLYGDTYTLHLIAGDLLLTVSAEPPQPVVSSGTVLAGQSGDVNSGEVSYRATVSDGGFLNVLSGGKANFATISSGGVLNVSNGGTARNTAVREYGRLAVFSGGTAESATVSNYASVCVSGNGLANDTDLAGYGAVFDLSGGTANNTVLRGNEAVFNVISGEANHTVLKGTASLNVSSGGTVNSVTVDSRGKLILSGGTANDTVVFSGSMFVSNGGMANRVEVDSTASLAVADGGTANGVVVKPYGIVAVSSGGAVNDVEVKSGGLLSVFYGGTVNDLLINEFASVNVTGGAADNLEVKSGGLLSVVNGGTATGILENGGYVSCGANATVSFLSNVISSLEIVSASATVHSGTTVNSATISGYRSLDVFSGGIVDQASVERGCMSVNCDGIVSRAEVRKGGSLCVSSGGTAVEVLENGGYVSVVSGANVTFLPNVIQNMDVENTPATVHSGTTVCNLSGTFGAVDVFSGGIVEEAFLDGCRLNVSSGGTATRVTVLNYGELYVAERDCSVHSVTLGYRGTATRLELRENDVLLVSEGGFAQRPVVSSGGSLIVCSGGVVSGAVVSSGGFATGLTIGYYNVLDVYSGGVVSDISVVNGGDIIIWSGGTADGVTVGSSGSLIVNSGGIVKNLNLESGCQLYLTLVPETYVQGTSGDKSFEIKDGYYSDCDLEDGYVYVCSGGMLKNTVANSNNMIMISSGGIAENVTLMGQMYLSSGGTADSVTVNSGGNFAVLENAKFRNIDVSSGGVVSGLTIDSDNQASVRIFSGGTAVNTVVSSGGSINGSDGVVFMDTIVCSGGTATSLTLEGSYYTYYASYNTLYVYSGGTASDISVNSCGSLNVSSGGTADSVTVNSGGVCVVNSGGIVNDIAVSSGGVVSGLTIDSDNQASVRIFSGGTAVNAVVSSGGSINGSDGVVFMYTTVRSGGTATGLALEGSSSYYYANYNTLYLSSGGTANDIQIGSYGQMDVFGGTVNGIQVGSNGQLWVHGGTVDDMILNGGTLRVFSGSAIVSQYMGGTIIASSGASVTVYSRTIANGQLVNDGAFFTYYDTTITSGGEMHLTSGASISKVELQSAGYLQLTDGVTASGIRIASGGYLEAAASLELNGVSLEQGASFAGIINAGSGLLELERISAGIVGGKLQNAVISGTVTLASDVEISGLSGDYTLDLSRCSQDSVIRGNDFTQTQFVFGDTDYIDLSGNYWGTADLDAIYAKLGVNSSRVRIDDVLSVNPQSSVFAIKSTDLEKNYLNGGRDTITVSFTGIPDASTVSPDTVILRNRAGKHLDIKDIQVVDNQIILTLNEFEEEGIYTLEFGSSITDSAGQRLSSLRFANLSPEIGDQLRFNVSFSGPVVLKAVPAGDVAGTIDVFQVYFNKAVAPESLKGNVSLIAPDGSTISPTGIRMLSDSIAEFTVAPQIVTGSYSIAVSENVTDCSGNKLNQNGTGANGETGDSFTGSFNLTEIDLTVGNVQVNHSLTAGKPNAISWDVSNASGSALFGSWTDGVYLSYDDKWDINDKLLATYTYSDGLPAWGTLQGEASLRLMGVNAGSYYLLVRSDIYNDEDAGVSASVSAQNLVATLVTVDVPQLTLGSEVTGRISASGEFASYRVRQKGGEAILLELDSQIDAANLEVYVGCGYAPDREHYDTKLQRITDASVTVDTGIADRDVYVTVYAKSVPAGFDYTLSARKAPASIDEVRQLKQADSNVVVLTVTGRNLTAGMKMRLVASDGTVLDLNDASLSGTTKLTATIDSATIPAGDYSLEVVDGSDVVSCDTPVSFRETTGNGHLEYSFYAPDVVGRHANHTLTITVSNTGTAPIEAPMLFFTPTQSHENGSETMGAILSLQYDQNAFWISSVPDGYYDSLSFFVNGDILGTIQPGETITIPIYYLGWRQDDWDFGNSYINWNINMIYEEDSTPFDWSEFLGNSGLPSGTAEELAESFRAEYGDTWGGYCRMLKKTIAYMDSIGVPIASLDAVSLLRFEMSRQIGGFQPFQKLADTDLTLAGSTIPLQVSYLYSVGKQSSEESSSFGFCWCFNWDEALSVSSEGDVRIGQNGKQRLYQPTASFGYQTVGEDGSTLAKNSSGYRLTEANGRQLQFDADGLLLYSIELTGDRIFCAHDAEGRVIRLTNSNTGEILSLVRDSETGFVTAMKDNFGRSVSFVYSEDGDLLSMKDSARGVVAACEYYGTTEHALTKLTDVEGNVSEYGYDELGRIVSVNQADSTVSLSYGEGGEVALNSGDENITLYYGANGSIAKITDNVTGRNTYYTNDYKGRFVSGVDSDGNAVSSLYSFAGGTIDVGRNDSDPSLNVNPVYNKQRNTNHYVVDGLTYYKTDNSGRSLNETDTADEYGVAAYDSSGRLVSYEFRKDGVTTTYTYRENGSVSISHDDPSQYFEIDGIKYYKKDQDGKVLSISDTTTDSYTVGYNKDGKKVYYAYTLNGRTTSYTYSVDGLLTSLTDPDGTTRYEYDADGNMTLEICPDGSRYAYDVDGRVIRFTSAGGSETCYTYDANGNPASIVAGGLSEYFVYSDDGERLLKYTDVQGNVYSYAYDSNGRQTSITVNDQTTSYTYDANGNVSSITNAAGETSYYEYNENGDLTRYTDAEGNSIVYTYNADSMPTEILYADGTKESYSYDANGYPVKWTGRTGQTAVYAWNADGDLVSVSYSEGGSYSYSYDSNGNLITASDISLSYDENDSLTGLVFADGRKVNYTYSADGLLTGYSDESGHGLDFTYTDAGLYDRLTDRAGALVMDYDYDNAGRLVKATRGNGTYSTYAYDAYGQVAAITDYSAAGAQVSSVRYTYDPEGKCASKETQDGVWAYSYDVKGQLVGAVFTDKTGQVTQDLSYEYDAAGNRIKSVENGVTTTYVYNSLNQIVSANGFDYVYDANGNLLEDEKRIYTWTADNRVASEKLKSTGQLWEYGYDALGNRVSSKTNGVTTSWTVDANGNVLAEYVDGVWNRTYYQGDLLAGFTDKDGNTYYFASDTLGSTLSVSGSDGAVVNSYSYDPFGNVLNSTEGVENDFTFVGGYGLMKNDSGTIYVRARNYDPETGRWISPDPIGIEGGENLYAYCGNDPVDNLDVSGCATVHINADSYPWHVMMNANGKYLSTQPDWDQDLANKYNEYVNNHKMIYTYNVYANKNMDHRIAWKIAKQNLVGDVSNVVPFFGQFIYYSVNYCSRAVARALNAGGYHLDRWILPSTLKMVLQSQDFVKQQSDLAIKDFPLGKGKWDINGRTFTFVYDPYPEISGIKELNPTVDDNGLLSVTLSVEAADPKGFNSEDGLSGYLWIELEKKSDGSYSPVKDENGNISYYSTTEADRTVTVTPEQNVRYYGVAVKDVKDNYNTEGDFYLLENSRTIKYFSVHEVNYEKIAPVARIVGDKNSATLKAGQSAVFSLNSEVVCGKGATVETYKWSTGADTSSISLTVTAVEQSDGSIKYKWSDGHEGSSRSVTLDVVDSFHTESVYPAVFAFCVVSEISTSEDPNDKTVMEGIGEPGYVAAGSKLSYKVEFENDPEFATAPAQWVRVFDTLDAEKFDLDSFELQNFCIAGNFFEVGDERDSFNDTVQLRIYDNTITATIAINLVTDEETGVTQLVAEFMAIDPDSGFILQDLVNGLLPVNDAIGAGEGYINYTLNARTDLPHGTELTNTAKIYFDFNDPIDTPTTINTIDSVNPALSSFGITAEGTAITLTFAGGDAESGIGGYNVMYSTDGENYDSSVFTSYPELTLTGAAGTTYHFKVQAVDNVGNLSAWSEVKSVDIPSYGPDNLNGTRTGLTWDAVSGAPGYVVEYSIDGFEHLVRINTRSNSLDSFCLPQGSYQWRVRVEDGAEWVTGESFTVESEAAAPQLVQSDADGNADVFFANAVGIWESGYLAQHTGSKNDWNGTNEYATVFGKNKLTDIIEGSTDANVLLMTDDANGDALFVDDIYSASPDELGLSQSRIARIDEIRAGAGDDIVDMTSQRFEYTGDGLVIRGGDGDDVIWANKGDNLLFGDAGNDRIAGASGDDVIVGGIGNDSMHGGGGNDVFTFCDNWGMDTVEQLETGKVTLWFVSGSLDNWDEASLTYTDGENSVKVSGVTADKVTLKFGDDGSAQFASLTSMGAFFDATSERIFEESGKGILASL